MKRLIVVTTTAAMFLMAGCSDSDTPGAAEGSGSPSSPSSSTSAWDPLAFKEPEWPAIPKGEPTTRQMVAGLSYIAEAYDYGLQTGYEMPIRDSGCGCHFEDEVAELAAAGQHLEMEPVRFKVIAMNPIQRVGKDVYSIQARVQIDRPEAVVADASGEKVDEEPARSDVADVILNVDTSGDLGWFINGYRPVGA